MTRVDVHAAERAASRLDPTIRAACIDRAVTYAAEHPTDRHAVRVHAGTAFVGTPWGADSNGHDVWAVIEDGVVRTFMYRRRTQPRDRAAFNVRYIALAD